MKRVPEGNANAESEQQLQALLEKLEGNQAFGMCRGKLGGIANIMKGFMEDNTSPTAALGKWDDFFGKARVMMNTLATLQRDGQNVAFNDLFAALTDQNFLFPGEVLPVEQTRPLTLVMLEPKKTIAFLRWLLEDHWDTLRPYVFAPEKERTELVTQLYAEFPSLEEQVRVFRNHGYEGKELRAAYEIDVTSTFPEKALQKGMKLELVFQQWNDHIEGMGEIPFVYLFEMEQSEVLKLFSRKNQKRIATWRLDVPKSVAVASIGLHSLAYGKTKEKEFNKRISLLSRNESNGYSAIALRHDDSYNTAWHSHAKEGTYGIRFHARLSSVD